MKKGILLAIGAYSCWGLFPLYWKLLHHVPAMQVIGYRIVWSFLCLAIALLVLHQWNTFRDNAFGKRVLGIYMMAALLIGVNWLTFIWAVSANHIVEVSLGYYIGPLISVLLGVLFFRENLRLWQWVSIGLAFAGVLYLTIAFGSLPWIALTLAITFSLYGLVKKLAPLSSLNGLLLETSILLLPAIGYLIFSNKAGNGTFLHTGFWIDALLIGGGLVTTIPLLMFASAAQRIPLSLIGILQFIGPTLQFLIGILVYHEPFTQTKMVGYSFVWIAFSFFCLEGFITYRKSLLVIVK